MNQIGIALTVLLVLFATHTAAAQSRVLEQDLALNNLIHPEGYQPAPPGELGDVIKRGHGARSMILIPGQGFGGTVFEDFMEANAARYTMYAVTLPGLGGTAAPPMPPEGTSYGKQTWINGTVEAVTKLIEKEKLDRPVLVGHMSLGTTIALRMAIDHPEKISRVVLIAGEAVRPLSIPETAPMSLQARQNAVDMMFAQNWFKTVTDETWDSNMWRPTTYASNPETASRLWKQSAEVPTRVMIRYLCEFLASDLSLEYTAIQVPTLVIQPGLTESYLASPADINTKLFFVDNWERVHGTSEHFTFVTIPESQLFIWKDQPEQLNEAIASFVEAI